MDYKFTEKEKEFLKEFEMGKDNPNMESQSIYDFGVGRSALTPMVIKRLKELGELTINSMKIELVYKRG